MVGLGFRQSEVGRSVTADGRVDWARAAVPGLPDPRPAEETTRSRLGRCGEPPHLPASGMIWSPVAVLRHSRPLPLTSDAVSSENPW